jgi:hypothetical protein
MSEPSSGAAGTPPDNASMDAPGTAGAPPATPVAAAPSKSFMRELGVGLAGALLGSLITWLVAASTGVLTRSMTDTQLATVAANVVDNANLRTVLLSRMAESGKFRGEKGDTGQKGERGPPGEVGPAWRPTVKVIEPIATKQPTVRQLGAHHYCSLNIAGGPHHNQACVCEVSRPGNVDWVLKVSLDSRVDGQCNCGAICFANP